MSEEKTKVIFRKYPDGNVIALLIEEPADLNPSHCNSYMHVGQHSAVDPLKVVCQTILASEEEYADLKEEMESLGYEFEVLHRLRRTHLSQRETNLKDCLHF